LHFGLGLLQLVSLSGKCAKLHTVAASNNYRDHVPRSLYYCLFVAWVLFLCAYLVHGKTHIQRNASQEVATTFPPFRNVLKWSHILFCEGCMWHALHILVTAPFHCDRKARAASAQSFTLWQQV